MGLDFDRQLNLFLILVFMFIITFCIEVSIIGFFLRKNIIKGIKFVLSVFVVNLITFPLIQVIASLVYTHSDNLFIILFWYCAIEFIPVSLESLIFIKIYGELNQSSYFRVPVNIKKTITSTVTANLVTFMIGAFLIIPQIIY